MFNEQIRKAMEHVIRSQPRVDDDGQAFPRVLVDRRQHPDRPSIMGPCGHEVISPNMVLPANHQAPAVVKAPPGHGPMFVLRVTQQALGLN